MDTIAFLREGRRPEQIHGSGHMQTADFIPHVRCKDGFRMSVQAGTYLYSTPREDQGPWTHVELGFPSKRPQPWEQWKSYCEDPRSPLRTVYGYVPVEMVEALIALHGGER